MQQHVRLTFSIPADGELGRLLFAYSRFERSFIIKEALNAYFRIGTPRVPTVASPPVAGEHRESSVKLGSSVKEGRNPSDFLGDFADE